MSILATNLRTRAQALGLSHAEVARRVGVSERRFGNYVTGIREPDLETLKRIALALNTTLDALASDAENEQLEVREALRERLNAAAGVLAEDDLEALVIQAEALAHSRGVRP